MDGRTALLRIAAKALVDGVNPENLSEEKLREMAQQLWDDDSDGVRDILGGHFGLGE